MMRRRIPVSLAAASLAIAAFGVSPAQAATASGTLGTVAFTATGSTLPSAATSKLKGWSGTLKQATAVTVEGYGGTKSVSKSKATALGLARAKAVKAWMAANKVGGTVTVVNKVHAASAGSDKGNRVVVIVTKRNVTVTVTSDYDAPPAGQAAVCNFTVASASASQGSTKVATATSGSAAGTCARSFTLKSVPTAKSTSIAVSFTCNESGDYMPADDVCTYVTTVAPWAAPTPEIGATTGVASLTAVTVGATTGSLAALELKVNAS